MKVLFVHQNSPAQFRHVAARLAADTANQVVYITHKGKQGLPNVGKIEYVPHRKPAKEAHHYLRSTENAVLYGQGVARIATQLKKSGFIPDVMIGHPGWGETLFLKDIFPDSPLISYCEFYYNPVGTNIDFDPEYPDGGEIVFRTRMRNSHHLIAAEAADALYAPTDWQRQQFPSAYRDKIEVIHDGIDCTRACPNSNATFSVENGPTFKPGDEVITYVARNLEPYRGFHSFMRALPMILMERPNAHAVIVGADGVSYGRSLPNGETYKDRMLKEVMLPKGRVHFTGQLPYANYLSLLQVSAAHVYLTYPFVLSWSCLEALSAGCVVVGSRTKPVEEVITDGENGLLVDFFKPQEIAERVVDVLGNEVDVAQLRRNARQSVLDNYELGKCQNMLDELIIRTVSP
ncbi:Glycosyltransferase involved in cell wall bisynthesis [Monaibacterium marinum]|uniref:Glycosyltransferase involved in cell wall bisynthesis n=1 Tax=Pontivivens marinum TaxID=1690039 RepID=A0A2C9CSR7_9RHOB|nr:glycosyltransferase family 4 protein [Monaibacterium marinum]SOH94302.1 Glycosyltransferase involved in cell wall bisynthesis [Monaibacterium marinum]